MNAAAAVSELIGEQAVAASRLAAGATGDIFTVELADGNLVVAKTVRAETLGATAVEAAGLAWLAEADAVAVPAVRAHDGNWLVIEYVAPGEPTAAAAERFGRELATLHAAGAPAHGAPPAPVAAQAWIGAAPMVNVACPDWPEFYVEHRVRPYLELATASGALDAAATRVLAMAAEAVPEVAGPPEPPARLHGDLWSGNVHAGRDGRMWLLDPAAHGGHRETDLAMLALFGAPYLDRILAAYQEAAPLADGWRRRVPLHQLFPLLVHTVLFGSAYAARTAAAAHAVLALR